MRAVVLYSSLFCSFFEFSQLEVPEEIKREHKHPETLAVKKSFSTCALL